MTLQDKSINRRNFLKVSTVAGGGMLLSFNWLTGCTLSEEEVLTLPKEWFELNSYIKIGDNGVATIYSANPEFGSNVKTSMPMIVAEELDVDWKKVIVEQADFYPDRFQRQFTGGSQGIRQGWTPLRTAGATARQLLINTAAELWEVPAEEITTNNGMIIHQPSGKKDHYGIFASHAATLEVPENIKLKEIDQFQIIGQGKKNVDADKIIGGAPLFSLDYYEEGMLTAMIVQPPAFGMQIKSFDASSVKNMSGIVDVFEINLFKVDYKRNFFDTTTFPKKIAIVGKSTWEVMQAKKALEVTYEPIPTSQFKMQGWGDNQPIITIPAGLESTEEHLSNMESKSKFDAQLLRKDGDPEKAFKNAATILERTYTAPFLAHNTMEPMNCFADASGEEITIYGPTQAPEFIRGTIAQNMDIEPEKIHIKLSRMGGGFGKRAYSHHILEAAMISRQAGAPVKLIYSREDDILSGVYRPAYTVTYRAALDANNQLIGFHVKGGGVPESPVYANRFPAGAIDNYLAESWEIPSNITIGAFRAPRSNFIAGAEQSFLDELAEAMGKDPIDFRLELLERATNNPVGERNDYDPQRYAGVIQLAKEKSNWKPGANQNRGFAAYFCHNTYVAEVLQLNYEQSEPKVEEVIAAVDCGIVVNPEGAINMAEGGIIDGIGNALFGELTFEEGKPTKTNFDTYRMIRMKEAPKSISVHFVENQENPTGLGEPLFPPTFGAIANAIYKVKGKRVYQQPFLRDTNLLG